MSFLGLDIGNTGCKAVAFHEDGKILGQAYREYPMLHPTQGFAELNSEEVIQHCFDVIKEVNAKITEPITAMCISSNGEAFTPVDENRKCLRNAMMASDNRATEEVHEFNQVFDRQRLYEITGHTAHPIFTLYKLLWLKKHEPHIWHKAKYFLCFEDLMIHKLGLPPVISWPLAGRTMMFDVTNHQWSKEITEVIGLDTSRLAKPLASGKVAGIIPEEIATQLGFTSKVSVVTGGHDQIINALGAGITEPGTCMYATGTVECFCPMFDRQTLTPQLMQNNLCCYDFALPNKFATVAYNLTGGNILKWFRDEFGEYDKLMADRNNTSVYNEILSDLPSKPTSLVVIPYFTGSGTPYFDNETKGAILGLEFTTRRKDIIKALLEGITLEMKLNLSLMEESGIEINTFIATGGGTRNDNWNQLKADILNKEIVVRNVAESGCFGAAMLACSATTGKSIDDLVQSSPDKNKVYIPNKENSALYDKKFEIYKAFYQSLSTINSVF